MGQQSAALCLSIVHVSQIKSITYVILNGRKERGRGRLGHFYSNGNIFLNLSRDFLIFNVDVPFFNQ